MEIIRKTLRRTEWYPDTETSFKAVPYRDEYFDGVIGLLTFTGLERPDVLDTPNGSLCVADNGYRWLHLAPREKHWVMTAMFDREGCLFQCYYDVTRKNDLADADQTVFYDMFLDVVVSGEGVATILDQDELKLALEQGVITEAEYEDALRTGEEIVREWSVNGQQIRRRLYGYLKQICNFTRVYFVRHAQADRTKDDRTRPLTAEGEKDRRIVPELLKDKEISVFYCSPYRRSLDTIRPTAEQYRMEIHVDERLRERKVGIDGYSDEALRKRWEDFHYHEENGESLAMLQERNMEALREILAKHAGENIVIGAHGAALSTILAYYQPDFGYEDFVRFVAWMPYVVELDFEGQELRGIVEHGYVDKGR